MQLCLKLYPVVQGGEVAELLEAGLLCGVGALTDVLTRYADEAGSCSARAFGSPGRAPGELGSDRLGSTEDNPTQAHGTSSNAHCRCPRERLRVERRAPSVIGCRVIPS